ncbi:MAG: LysM peptidoglycan-binding domain-containing protein [Pseudomonadota bacterium]
MRPKSIWLIFFLVLAFLPLYPAGAEELNKPSSAVQLAAAPSGLEEEASDALASEAEFDIPITVNDRVKFFINHFQTAKRKPFRNWLSRSTRYIPRMREILRENGLPEDLVYLAMIESGFNVRAYSPAHACGPWQFIKETGERYGLTVGRWLDERRDPDKATTAAAKYLKKLYEEFGCWYLAAAGYNAGENRVRRGIKTFENADYWDMCAYDLFSRETKDYVPQIIAAAIIAKTPERYGFNDVDYQEPLRCARINVPPQTDLKAVALACGVDYQMIGVLNAELVQGCTPPYGTYKISIPEESREPFGENFHRVKRVTETRYHKYITGKGDTVAKVAKRLGVSKNVLARTNKIKGKRLKAGRVLKIPYQVELFVLSPKGHKSPINLACIETGDVGGNEQEEQSAYTVQKGDTLFSVAKRFGLPLDSLRKLNDLSEDQKIRVGQKLAVASPAGKAEIADKKSLKKLIVKAKKDTRYTYYRVRKGDTVWRIAQKYRVIPAEIRSWNNLQDNTLLPGARLKLKVS